MLGQMKTCSKTQSPNNLCIWVIWLPLQGKEMPAERDYVCDAMCLFPYDPLSIWLLNGNRSTPLSTASLHSRYLMPSLSYDTGQFQTLAPLFIRSCWPSTSRRSSFKTCRIMQDLHGQNSQTQLLKPILLSNLGATMLMFFRELSC